MKEEVKGSGVFSSMWKFVKDNAKGIIDVTLFAAGVGLIYAFGEDIGEFATKQIPTEESTKAYYNELMAEMRGGAPGQ